MSDNDSIDRSQHTDEPLVLEVGSTSTKVITTDVSMAVPWGTDNLHDTWLTDDPPPPDALTNALGTIDDFLVDLDREHAPTVHHVIVRGAAASAIARLEQGTDHPISPLTVERRDVEEVFRLVADEPLDERRANPGLNDPESARTIVAALCIVLATARRYRSPRLEFDHHSGHPEN